MSAPRWRRPWAVLTTVALVLGVLAAIAMTQRSEVGLDDVFITYRYAQNLAAGNGFVFNPGERVFGTTAPGFGLLLAGLHRLTGVSIPWLGTISTGLAALAISLLVFVRARAAGRGLEAFCGGLLLVTTSYLWIHAGSEIPVALALILTAGLVIERWPVMAGLLAGFAVWCRPDVLLAAGVVGLIQWREERRLPWRYGLVVGAVVAAGLALAWSWFGVPLPSTLEAKRIQASLGANFWASGWAFWGTAYQSLFMVEPASRFGFLFLGLFGWVPLVLRGGRTGRVLGSSALVLLVAYPLLGVPYYTWYSLPVVIALCFGFPFAAGELARRAYRFFGSSRGACAVTALVVLAVFGATSWRLGNRAVGVLTHPAYDPRYYFYREVGLWLRDHAQPGDDLAFVEVGTIAFFSRLPMRDQLGLVTPESLPFLAGRDMAGAFLNHPTALYLADEKLGGFTLDVVKQPWFATAYAEEKRIENRPAKRTLVIYRRVPGAPLPPARPPLSPAKPE